MSDPLFAAIRDEMLTQMLAEELVRGSADWSHAMSLIDEAEAAYKHLGESQAEQVRIIKGAVEVNQQLRARIAELEDPHYTKGLLARIAEMEAEQEPLRAALEKICSDVWGYSDIDGGEVQDYLEASGLLVEVPASDDFRAEYDCDTMFQLRWRVPNE